MDRDRILRDIMLTLRGIAETSKSAREYIAEGDLDNATSESEIIIRNAEWVVANLDKLQGE